MTVYVDPLMAHGWILRGREVQSCHMFTDQVELDALHRIATMIGCRREWFQDKAAPHYDLTLTRRQEAIGCGALPVTRRQAVEIWRARRAAVDAVLAQERRPVIYCTSGSPDFLKAETGDRRFFALGTRAGKAGK